MVKLSKTKSSAWTGLLILSLLFLNACATTGGRSSSKASYPHGVNSQMQREFQAAESLFRQKNYAQAALAYGAYTKAHPYNRLTDQSQFRLGQIHLVQKRAAQASQVLETLIKKSPDPAMVSRARVKAGIARYRLREKTAALSHLEKSQAEHLGPADRRKLSALGWRLTSQAPLEKRMYYVALSLDSAQDGQVRRLPKVLQNTAFLREKLSDWSKEPSRLALVDSRFASYPASESAPYIHWKLAQAYAQEGKNKKARWHLKRLLSRHPNFESQEPARLLLAKLGDKSKKASQADAQVLKVGVLLPLSGKYQKYGLGTLQGMECAASLKAPCQAVHNIQLIVRDDGGDPGKAVSLVEDLVKKEKVSIILGPLSSASAVAAAKKAEQLGVTMISLAQKEGIPSLGSKIFRYSLTPDQQAKALLKLAGQKRKLKRLAVLYPSNQYGQVFSQKFSEHATQYNTKIVASQSYGNARDLQSEIRELKLSSPSANPDRPYGFEALLLPDSFAAAAAIITQLDWAGFQDLKLFGTNAWNDERLASLESELLAGAVFVDLYFKNSNKPAVRRFRQQFKGAFSKTPGTLEAMGFDVVKFLGQAFQEAPEKAPAHQMLLSKKNYQGVTALRGFVSRREAKLRPYLLGFSQGKIVELAR